MSAERFLVTRPHPKSGVGSNLASLAGAVWLARESGRTLIVDWRGLVFLRDKTINYFTQFFRSVPEIMGVPLLYAPAVEADGYADEQDDDALVVALDDYRNARDIAGRSLAPSVVLTHYHPLDRLDRAGDPLQQLIFTRRVYDRILPRSDLQSEIDDFAGEHLAYPFVIGINVATGNGLFEKGSPYYMSRIDNPTLENEDRLLSRLERACTRCTRTLPRYLRGSARVFYATDSAPMSALLSELPNSVTRRTVYPPPGSGRDFNDFESLGTTDLRNAAEVIADMFLLARCDALIRNFSMFSYYGTVMTGHYSGNLVDLESLFPLRHLMRRARNRLRREVVRRRAG